MTENISYAKIREYYCNTELPETLVGTDKYYFSLKSTIFIWLSDVDSEIEIHGSNVKKSLKAMTTKKRLIDLYFELKKKENWNVTLAEYNAILDSKIKRSYGSVQKL